MGAITGVGTTWNLPNYAGELFTASGDKTPLLTMIGGLTGGVTTENMEFTTGQLYDMPDPEQPGISENASILAPEPKHVAREQLTNVVQIHQETIQLTYAKKSNKGRLAGLNTAGQQASPPDEESFQRARKLDKIARDVEHSFIQGKFKRAASADEANQTRGLLELCEGGQTIDAAAAPLTKAMIDTLVREMANNGADFGNMVMLLPAYLKQVVSEIYFGLASAQTPATRNIGGYSVTEIETDFARFGIAWDMFMPKDSVLFVDVAAVQPVFQEVPGKGVLFEEPLGKQGASDAIQMYGQIGLDHGPAFLHGSITGLEVK